MLWEKRSNIWCTLQDIATRNKRLSHTAAKPDLVHPGLLDRVLGTGEGNGVSVFLPAIIGPTLSASSHTFRLEIPIRSRLSYPHHYASSLAGLHQLSSYSSNIRPVYPESNPHSSRRTIQAIYRSQPTFRLRTIVAFPLRVQGHGALAEWRIHQPPLTTVSSFSDVSQQTYHPQAG